MTAIKAFVLIETEVGRVREAVSALKQLEGVESADQVTGPYDVIAVLEGESLTAIGDLVTGKIKDMPGISRSATCLSLTRPCISRSL
jgi:DNA-binding Lrp family transcriptional regulator